MARRLPMDRAWTEIVLEREERLCSACGKWMHVKRYRRRHVYTLNGPVRYVLPLVHCPDGTCPNHHRRFSPQRELSLALPRWLIGWDVFCWLGHRRFARHWSVPQLRAELHDSYAIELSEDAIEDYPRRYQCMLAARQQDFALMRREYARNRTVVLSIDGLQPELDSHAKVQMRGKIRGLRGIEREVLKQRASTRASQNPKRRRAALIAATAPRGLEVVLDYCAAVRGILNDGQGGPMRPPGLRMSAALGEVRRSLQRGLQLTKGGAPRRC